jgi:isopentenyl-diphosphate delta-isomerase
MTGGTSNAIKINAAIARAVEELDLGLGVGSQRVAIENPNLEKTFNVVRKEAPHAFVMANLGAAQLVKGYGIKEATRAVEMLKADALTIHLNPLQEAVQPEGETSYVGVAKAIGRVVDELDVPVIVKETGCGIGAAEAMELDNIGVAAINLAGAGGSSWAAVEFYRARKHNDETGQRLGEAFWDWGIPTAASLVEVARRVKIPIIASGGIRSGIDMAKALAVGASLTGVAYPVLDPATHGADEAKKKLQFMIDELRNTMFLVGADSVEKLKKVPVIFTGKMADWLTMRGFNVQIYARRGLQKSGGN